LIGLAQYAVTAVLLFCALWFAALFLIHEAPVGSVDVPYLGRVPTPVVLLSVTLLIGFLLAQALRLHAGWLGRRWARRIGDGVTREVRERITESLLLPIDAAIEIANNTNPATNWMTVTLRSYPTPVARSPLRAAAANGSVAPRTTTSTSRPNAESVCGISARNPIASART